MKETPDSATPLTCQPLLPSTQDCLHVLLPDEALDLPPSLPAPLLLLLLFFPFSPRPVLSDTLVAEFLPSVSPIQRRSRCVFAQSTPLCPLSGKLFYKSRADNWDVPGTWVSILPSVDPPAPPSPSPNPTQLLTSTNSPPPPPPTTPIHCPLLCRPPTRLTCGGLRG